MSSSASVSIPARRGRRTSPKAISFPSKCRDSSSWRLTWISEQSLSSDRRSDSLVRDKSRDLTVGLRSPDNSLISDQSFSVLGQRRTARKKQSATANTSTKRCLNHLSTNSPPVKDEGFAGVLRIAFQPLRAASWNECRTSSLHAFIDVLLVGNNLALRLPDPHDEPICVTRTTIPRPASNKPREA